jgi:hypothetical protein
MDLGISKNDYSRIYTSIHPCGLGLQWYDEQASPEPGGFNWIGGLYLAGVIATGLYAALAGIRVVVWIIKRLATA